MRYEEAIKRIVTLVAGPPNNTTGRFPVPVDIMRHLEAGTEWTVEWTTDGILYRPWKDDEALPDWVPKP